MMLFLVGYGLIGFVVGSAYGDIVARWHGRARDGDMQVWADKFVEAVGGDAEDWEPFEIEVDGKTTLCVSPRTVRLATVYMILNPDTPDTDPVARLAAAEYVDWDKLNEPEPPVPDAPASSGVLVAFVLGAAAALAVIAVRQLTRRNQKL